MLCTVSCPNSPDGLRASREVPACKVLGLSVTCPNWVQLGRPFRNRFSLANRPLQIARVNPSCFTLCVLRAMAEEADRL
jgi:hypothetical protein